MAVPGDPSRVPLLTEASLFRILAARSTLTHSAPAFDGRRCGAVRSLWRGFVGLVGPDGLGVNARPTMIRSGRRICQPASNQTANTSRNCEGSTRPLRS